MYELNYCKNFRTRTKNKKYYYYCTKQRIIINKETCYGCELVEPREYKKIPIKNKKVHTRVEKSGLHSKRSKACDIPDKVKKIVWERDNHKCVVCGCCVNVMPNAHFIPRSKGGLGIEQNIVTLCTLFTENKCHYKYDNGTKEEHDYIEDKIRNYLRAIYPGWNEKNLYYRKEFESSKKIDNH